MIVLTPLKKFTFPINAECISPDVFQGKDTAEIANLPFPKATNKENSVTSSKSKKTTLKQLHHHKRRRKQSPQESVQE